MAKKDAKISQKNAQINARKKNRHAYLWMAVLLLAATLLGTIARFAPALPSATAQNIPASAGQPLVTRSAVPSVHINPDFGPPDTISGSGFPVDSTISIYLHSPHNDTQKTEALSATTDKNGIFSISLSIPSRWSDGTPLQEGHITIETVSQSGGVKAQANFDYLP